MPCSASAGPIQECIGARSYYRGGVRDAGGMFRRTKREAGSVDHDAHAGALEDRIAFAPLGRRIDAIAEARAAARLHRQAHAHRARVLGKLGREMPRCSRADHDRPARPRRRRFAPRNLDEKLARDPVHLAGERAAAVVRERDAVFEQPVEQPVARRRACSPRAARARGSPQRRRRASPRGSARRWRRPAAGTEGRAPRPAGRARARRLPRANGC